MKNCLLTTVLNWVLAASLILSVIFFVRFYFSTHEIRTYQSELAQYQNNQAFLQLLIRDVSQYGMNTHNPDIERILESIGIKLNETKPSGK